MGALATPLLIAGTAASAYQQSEAAKAEGSYRRTVADINRSASNAAADDAIARGEKAAGQLHKKTKQLIGAQRAAMGASGVSVNGDTSTDLTYDSERLGALDALTIKTNAAREAFGYRTQGANFSAQGKFASLSAENTSRSTLLTGGMNALNYYRNR